VQRWDVLSEHNFRPSAHMVARHDGLVTWAADVPEELKSMTLRYFRSICLFKLQGGCALVVLCINTNTVFQFCASGSETKTVCRGRGATGCLRQ
jgi:hypothetical protein